MPETTSTLEVVSHTQDGRVLSGVGADPETLQKVMARHAPPTPESETPAEPAAAPVTPEPPVTAPPAEPDKTRGQKRFDKLTAQRTQAEDAAHAAQAENAELKRRLEALKAAQQRVTSPAVQATPPPPQPASMPLPQAPTLPTLPPFPPHLQNYDAFLTAFPNTSYDDYQRAQMAYVFQAGASSFDARIRSSIEADRASRSRAAQVEQTWAKGRQVYPDFDTVRASGPGASVDLGSQARIDEILASPHSEHLQYVIAKDRAFAERLASASDFEFARLLASITPGSSVASAASTGVTGSATPPAPMQPVGSGSKTTTPSSAELAGQGFDFDKSGYRARRAAERGVRSRY